MTLLLIAANVLIFIAMVLASGWETIMAPTSKTLLDWGANLRPLTMGGEPWRLFTCAFLHVGIIHLAMNMVGLFVVGPLVETLYGRSKLLVMYIFSAIGGSLYSVAFNPDIVSAGASGAIFGLFGSWLGFFLAYRNRLEENFVKANIRAIGFILVYNLFMGFVIPNIDTAAHIGGFITGCLSALMLVPDTPGDQSWRLRDYLLAAVMAVGLIGMTGGLENYLSTSVPEGKAFADLKPLVRGIQMTRNGKFDDALAEFSAVIKRNPKNAYAYVVRANVLRRLKQYRAALKDTDAAISLNAKLLDAYLVKSNTLVDMGSFDDALIVTNQAIELNPQSAECYRSRSVIYDRMGDAGKTLEDSRKAVELAPDEPAPYINRGFAFLSMGLIDDAIKDFDTVLGMKPSAPNALYGKIMCYYMQEDFAKCVDATRTYMNKAGWKDDSAPYAMILGVLAAKGQHKMDAANEFLTTTYQKITQKDWPAPVFKYLDGELTADALFKLAVDKDKMTEARGYVALDLLNQKKTAEAVPLLIWVKEHGNVAFNEYDLAVNALNRMKK